MLAAVVEPVSVESADKTTLPVPVDVVVPVPPRVTASVPVAMFEALRAVRDAPLPLKVPAVTVPVRVGPADKTTLPEPVDVVVPVPPRATTKTPLATFAAFNEVRPAPDPENRSAVAVPLALSVVVETVGEVIALEAISVVAVNESSICALPATCNALVGSNVFTPILARNATMPLTFSRGPIVSVSEGSDLKACVEIDSFPTTTFAERIVNDAMVLKLAQK